MPFWIFLDKKKREFLERLKSIEESIPNRDKKVLIYPIRDLHNKYLTMVSKEIVLIGSEEHVPLDSRYVEEMKKTLDQLTESINKLTIALQTGLIKKIELFQKSDINLQKYPLSLFSLLSCSGQYSLISLPAAYALP